MSNPVILYCGERVVVTQDTARELIERGDATLVEGELTLPLSTIAVSDPAEEAIETLLAPGVDTVDLTPNLEAMTGEEGEVF